MDDWLAELHESKQKVIERAQVENVHRPLPPATTPAQFQQRQDLIIALAKTVQVEQLMQQFATRILEDHPLFSNTSLTRTMHSKAVGSPVELTEPAPWSAPVEGNPLPDSLALGNDHYVVGITWKLQSDYSSLHGIHYKQFRLKVSVSADGVLFDDHILELQTADAFKTRLTTTFKHTLDQLGRHRVRRRHHRPWYKRLLRALSSESELTPGRLILVFIVLVFVILIATFVAQIFLRQAF